MTETPSTPAPAPTTTPAVATPTEPGPASTELQIPKSRFDEVNTRAKAAEAELERIKAEQAAADEVRAKAEGKFQELADKREITINALTPKLKASEERAERFEKVLRDHVQALLKEAPPFVVDAIKDREPDAQLDYINKYREQWASETSPPAPVARGAGPGPRSVGSPGRDELIRNTEAEMRASGRYPRF